MELVLVKLKLKPRPAIRWLALVVLYRLISVERPGIFAAMGIGRPRC